MKHCLLFGGRGHLARTKIIPRLKDNNVPYTVISRKQKEILKAEDNLVAYMSIPTTYFFDHIQNYINEFKIIKPTFILEKPHGNSLKQFNEVCEYFNTNNYNYYFNDHYLFKDWADVIHNAPICYQNVKSIHINIQEIGCINERLQYFETSGILLDMYQTHTIIIISHVLHKIFPDDSLLDILKVLSTTKYSILNSGRYPCYQGIQDTFISLEMKYKNITISCQLEKNAEYEDKAIYLLEKPKKIHRIPLSTSDGYDIMIKNLKNNNYTNFLSNKQVEYLWKHTEYNQ